MVLEDLQAGCATAASSVAGAITQAVVEESVPIPAMIIVASIIVGANVSSSIHEQEVEMGVRSKRLRYREEGEQANAYNVESFGKPARSLFLSTDVIKIGMKTDITDSHGNVVYHSERKTVSAHDKTEIVDADGRPVAHLEKVIPSLRDHFRVTLADGTSFEIASELLHVVNEVYNISELGWQLRGRLATWNFQIFDGDGQIIAVISEKVVSIHDKYCIDIYRTEHEGTVIAILVALQHAIRYRKKRAVLAASRI